MMLFNKNKNSQNDSEQKKRTINGLKLGMVGSILSKSKEQDNPESQFRDELKGMIVNESNSSENLDDGDLVDNLTKIIQKSYEKMIVPRIDFTNGQITYPILEKIGKSVEDV